MNRQNLIILIFIIFEIIASCCQSNLKTQTNSDSVVANNQNAEKINLIVNLKSINGKTLSEVEKLLGKAEKTEKIKGYPCKNTNCQKVIFKNGKIEIIFKLNKADRITIYNIPNLTENDNALEALGMYASKPFFKNPGTVIRWQDIENINEISFFTDYVLIQITKPE